MVVSALRKILSLHSEVDFAVLFGSTASGRDGPRSDIDLAVTLRGTPGAWDLGELAVEVERATGRRLEIVMLESARSALLRHEIAKGKLLKGDPERWIEFRRRAFREWREVGPRFRRLSDAYLRRAEKPRG